MEDCHVTFSIVHPLLLLGLAVLARLLGVTLIVCFFFDTEMTVQGFTDCDGSMLFLSFCGIISFKMLQSSKAYVRV